MKKVLFIAPYFLPRRRVGSMRPFRFAIHLREFGWDPTVVTLQARGQKLTAKESELLDGINIVELEPPLDGTRNSESNLGNKKGGAATSKAALPWAKPVIDRVVSGGRGALDRFLPVDAWMPVFLRYYPRLRELALEHDVLWSTGDPWSGLVIGARLAKSTKRPWVADFRDPWTLCKVRTAKRHPWAIRADQALERNVIETTRLALFQATGNERKYRDHFGDAMPPSRTVYNSYDLQLFEGARPQPRQRTGVPLKIGFFGRFRELSPARPIVDALAAAAAIDRSVLDDVHVYSVGDLATDDQNYAASRGVEHMFRTFDSVPLERSLEALGQFDALLLSTHALRDEIIPAKIFEYMMAQRPVISMSPNPEVGNLVERTGVGVQVRDAAIAGQLIADSVRALRAGEALPIPFSPNKAEIARFEARETTRELAAIFDEIVES